MLDSVLQTLTAPVTVWSYVPALAYLLTVTALTVAARTWHPVHLIGLLFGLTARVAIDGVDALLPLVIVAPMFLIMVWSLYKTISATGVASLCVALALVPFPGWFWLGVALLVATIVAVARTPWQRTREVAIGSLLGIGVTPSGISRPSLSYLPQKGAQDRKKTLLPPYYLAGTIVGAVGVVVGF